MAKAKEAVSEVLELKQTPVPVVSKIKVSFVLSVPGYLEGQAQISDFIREGIDNVAEGLIASLESVDIASI